jgi:cytochrome oxidase Cu insertion factor (SCO1/SenC/PrrC family)
MLKRCFSVLSAIALILGAAESAASEKKIPAPDWQLTDVDGKPVKLSDFRGKVWNELPRRDGKRESYQ